MSIGKSGPDVITKTTKVEEAERILRLHNIRTPNGWEIVIGMLLGECDHLEVHNYGKNAYFLQVDKGALES